MAKSDKTQVLIVDDSAVVRDILHDILTADKDIEVCGKAADPFEAVRRIQECTPDVITLDLEMPKMDGITFLRKMMKQHPIPTIVISSHTGANVHLALQAYESGALYVLNKPEIESRKSFAEYAGRICAMVKTAGKQKGHFTEKKVKEFKGSNLLDQERLMQFRKLIKVSPMIIGIGASAGGTNAIETILQSVHQHAPCILITQHMPAGFTSEFAQRLNQISLMEVREAQGGELIEPGKVFIAPGDQHLVVSTRNNQCFTALTKGELVNYHRPSVDVLFNSIVEHYGMQALSFILSGMGKDGSKSMLRIKEAGGATFAQDEKTSLVYGMPAEAIRIGAALSAIPIEFVAPLINKLKNP